MPFYNDSHALISVSTPLYYIIPQQWAEVLERLAAHGVDMQRLAEPLTIEVESYRFTEVKWGSASFEGHVLVTQKNQPLRERRTYATGSVVVPMAQAAGRLAINLLEPDAPDSFVYWGFFNTIFEQKEYGEGYVLEKLAREMLSKDEKLRKEFEARLAKDPQFAASARRRLNFFYDRSPYHDPLMNVYPVGRITTPINARLTDYR